MNILKEFTTEDIYVRHAIDENPDANVFNFHVHDKCEIYFFVSGNAEYLVEGSVYPLSKGSLLIMRPEEAHCVRILGRETYERFAVNFPLTLFDTLDPRQSLTRIYTARKLGSENMFITSGLRNVFDEMFDESADDYERRLKILLGILKILEMLNSDNTLRFKADSGNNSYEGKILRYINEHLLEDMSVDTLSDYFSLSRSQFGRIFKKATGTSPWDYISAKRLLEAKKMIAAGLSAKEAAISCGFRDYSVFYRAFVKRFGRSPSELLN